MLKCGRVENIVQILSFRFSDGKTFHGDRYDGRDDSEVEALCNFYDVENEIVTLSKRPHCYVNVKGYRKHIFLKRDLQTGRLSMI